MAVPSADGGVHRGFVRMTGTIIYDPLLDWPLIWVAFGLVVIFTAIAFLRGLSGWWLRGLAGLLIFVALINPSLQREERDPLSDIVILVVDESASQSVSDRSRQVARAVASVEAEIAALGDTDVRTVTVEDGEEDRGTLLMSAVAQAVAEVPQARLAGVFLISDGLVHDMDRAPDMSAPLHLLMTGRSDDWDRRIRLLSAPAFAIIGEPVTIRLMVEDQGAVPSAVDGTAELRIAVDGRERDGLLAPIGVELELSVTLAHGGTNVIQFSLPGAEGELTARNNAAVVEINGVRDRLRVLLVSGSPHPGERTWRNLLKSDSSVDVVHFTILRPPSKQDGTPPNELSLIAFPTRELFIEKIEEFDLIVFDRYKLRGILPSLYLENISRYVEDGGAVLVAAGPDFAQAASLYRSPLGEIMPARPTSVLIEEGYRPAITELGQRHPVTAGLPSPEEEAEGEADWGRWFRLVELEKTAGTTVMSGIGDRPLLVLDRVGEGRFALLGSDHAWLWSRGFEGGGPQLELLRRLAHWMMKEPDLEEEALTVAAEGQTMTITRRTLRDGVGEVNLTTPDGTVTEIPLEEVGPGRFEAVVAVPELGLYRLEEGGEEAVVALGPAAPREFERTVASADALASLVKDTRGGIARIEDGVPDLRKVRSGRPASGRGWLGVTPRDAYVTAHVAVFPLAPAWLFLIIGSLLVIGAWLREGRV